VARQLNVQNYKGYVVLPMLFPMLKGTNLGKTAVFWACSSLCAWDEPHKYTGWMDILCKWTYPWQ